MRREGACLLAVVNCTSVANLTSQPRDGSASICGIREWRQEPDTHEEAILEYRILTSMKEVEEQMVS